MFDSTHEQTGEESNSQSTHAAEMSVWSHNTATGRGHVHYYMQIWMASMAAKGQVCLNHKLMMDFMRQSCSLVYLGEGELRNTSKI